jgi:hypothetical protein
MEGTVSEKSGGRRETGKMQRAESRWQMPGGEDRAPGVKSKKKQRMEKREADKDRAKNAVHGK